MPSRPAPSLSLIHIIGEGSQNRFAGDGRAGNAIDIHAIGHHNLLGHLLNRLATDSSRLLIALNDAIRNYAIFHGDRYFDFAAKTLCSAAAVSYTHLDVYKRQDKPCPHGDLKLRMYLTAAGYAAYLHAFTCVYRENVRTGAMSQWSRESGRRVYERSRSVAEMLGDVDEFSQKRYTEQVGRFRDWYLYVMLWNAPSARVLREPDARRVYRALPFSRRLTYRLKRLLAPLRG